MKKLSIEEIAKALGADEVIQLRTPASAGSFTVAAEARSIRRERFARAERQDRPTEKR